MPGPWAGAACPSRPLGCQGKIEPFHTLKGDKGQLYMYRCASCDTQVILDFMLTTAEYKQ